MKTVTRLLLAIVALILAVGAWSVLHASPVDGPPCPATLCPLPDPPPKPKVPDPPPAPCPCVKPNGGL